MTGVFACMSLTNDWCVCLIMSLINDWCVFACMSLTNDWCVCLYDYESD